MPEMDGIETLHKLKEMYPTKAARIPIIALTASAILGDKERLLKEGFTDYLSKPVNISDMEEMLGRYLGESPTDSALDSSQVLTTDEYADTYANESEEIPVEIRQIKALDYEMV